MANYRETFVSPYPKDTYEEALKVLNEIRRIHSEEKGWREIKGYIELLPNGKCRAVREHEKVS